MTGVIPALCIESPLTSARKKPPTSGNKRATELAVLQGSPASKSHRDKFTIEGKDCKMELALSLQDVTHNTMQSNIAVLLYNTNHCCFISACSQVMTSHKKFSK